MASFAAPGTSGKPQMWLSSAEWGSAPEEKGSGQDKQSGQKNWKKSRRKRQRVSPQGEAPKNTDELREVTSTKTPCATGGQTLI